MILDRRFKMQEELMSKEINKHVHKSNQTFPYGNYNNVYLGAFRKKTELNTEHKIIYK